MNRYGTTWGLILALGLCSGSAAGQPASTASAPTTTTAATEPAATEPAAPTTMPDEQAVWRRVWAYRAARAEAAVGLAAQIQALPLGGQTKVGDFLAESPQLQQALNAFLLGPEPVAARHTDEGFCEVVVELRLADLAAALNEIRARYYKGQKFASVDFAGLTRQPEIAPLRQQGRAKAHPALLGEAFIPHITGAGYFDRAGPEVRQFWQEHVTEAGRAAAEARAREDALRRLGERIKDVSIDEQTRLADYVAGGGERGTDTRQFLRGARERGLRYDADAPIAEVEMTVSLRTVYACLKAWALLHEPGRDIRPLEQLVAAARSASIRQAGIGSPDEGQLKTKDAQILRSLALVKSAPDWVGRSLRETGRAAFPAGAGDREAAREQAARAAEWHARAALAGRLEELPAAEETTVGQLAGQDKNARAALLAALLDARAVAAPSVAEDGTAEVTLELPLMSVWRLILHWQRQGRQ